MSETTNTPDPTFTAQQVFGDTIEVLVTVVDEGETHYFHLSCTEAQKLAAELDNKCRKLPIVGLDRKGKTEFFYLDSRGGKVLAAQLRQAAKIGSGPIA